MSRRSLPSDIKYTIPNDIFQYGSWDYIQKLPRYDANLFKIFLNKYGVAFAHQKKFDEFTSVKSYFQFIKNDTDEYKKLCIEFDKFKMNNSWVQEYYDFCLSKTAYVTDPFDPEGHWVHLTSTYSPSDIEKANRAMTYFKQKLDYSRFNAICCKNDAFLLFFNEIKRDLPFVVGNIVRLRKKYINSRTHDPFYYNRELRNEERVGHIVAILDDTHSNSYNGKGSRLVQVYWAASGEVNKQSVGSLKLFDQKNNKLVDKIMDE